MMFHVDVDVQFPVLRVSVSSLLAGYAYYLGGFQHSGLVTAFYASQLS